MDKTLLEVRELISLACKKLREDSAHKHEKLIWVLEDAINLFYKNEEITSSEDLFLSDKLIDLVEQDEEKIVNK